MKCRDGSRFKWFKFYPLDWLADVELRRCSIAARGLWIDLVCLMTQGRDYGRLVDANGEKITNDQLAFDLRYDLTALSALVKELTDKRVCSVDESGVIYSRRMVRDQAKSERLTENGKRGGNPDLKTLKMLDARGYMLDARGWLTKLDNQGVNQEVNQPADQPPQQQPNPQSLPAAWDRLPEDSTAAECLEYVRAAHSDMRTRTPEAAILSVLAQYEGDRKARSDAINDWAVAYAGDMPAPGGRPMIVILRSYLRNASKPKGRSAEMPDWKRLEVLEAEQSEFSARNPHPERWTAEQRDARKARMEQIAKLKAAARQQAARN